MSLKALLNIRMISRGFVVHRSACFPYPRAVARDATAVEPRIGAGVDRVHTPGVLELDRQNPPSPACAMSQPWSAICQCTTECGASGRPFDAAEGSPLRWAHGAGVGDGRGGSWTLLRLGSPPLASGGRAPAAGVIQWRNCAVERMKRPPLLLVSYPLGRARPHPPVNNARVCSGARQGNERLCPLIAPCWS